MIIQKQALLHALDIPVWKERVVLSGVGGQDAQVQSLPVLQQCVADCKRCPLHQTRAQTVFGVGNTKAKLMIIGEAPGFHEDQQGEPFVGRAGQLLNAMLHAIGLERSEIYIANILKCRPPENRDPLPEEVAQCTPYLKQQIALIQPTVLCAVGRIAAQYLLKTTLSLSKLRGKVHAYGEEKRPLLITYHPAYLLRNPSAKADAYRDLLLLQDLLN
jgi:uracil-DNA glycosylase family 4